MPKANRRICFAALNEKSIEVRGRHRSYETQVSHSLLKKLHTGKMQRSKLETQLAVWGLTLEGGASSSTKNMNFTARDASGRRYFVKNAPKSDSGLLHENLVIEQLSHRDLPFELPRIHRFDARLNLLVLEWIEDQEAEPSPRILGGCLRALHRTPLALTQHADPYACFLGPSPRSYAAMSAAELSLISFVQSRPEATRALVELHTRRDVCVHGDFKRANVMIGREGLVLIDWERAAISDPCRDLGAFIADRLWDELFSGRALPEVAISKARPAISALLEGYRADGEETSRAIAWSGAQALLQSLARAQYFDRFDEQAQLVAFYAVELLVSPDAWRRRLLTEVSC
jgi:hypothetical protein